MKPVLTAYSFTCYVMSELLNLYNRSYLDWSKQLSPGLAQVGTQFAEVCLV